MIIKKTDRGVQVSVAGFNVQIGAPRGQFLEKKEYQGAKRYAFSETAPGLDVTGPGRGAGNVFGAFVVWELEMQGNNITAAAVMGRVLDVGPHKLGEDGWCENAMTDLAFRCVGRNRRRGGPEKTPDPLPKS
jgi:hypothetical protein